MSILEKLYLRLSRIALLLKQRATLCAQIALVENRKLLLVRYPHLSGWHLPGGSVRAPETPEATVSRVLERETGYNLVDHPELLGVFPELCPHGRKNYLAVFASRDFRQVDVRPETRVLEACWFDLMALPQDATEACRKVAGVLID